jgi:hypothetical protein
MYVITAAAKGASPPPMVLTPQTPSFAPHAVLGLQLLVRKHWMYIWQMGISLGFWVMQSGQVAGMF